MAAGKHREEDEDEDELQVPTLVDPDNFRRHENEECTPALFNACASSSLRCFHSDQVRTGFLPFSHCMMC